MSRVNELGILKDFSYLGSSPGYPWIGGRSFVFSDVKDVLTLSSLLIKLYSDTVEVRKIVWHIVWGNNSLTSAKVVEALLWYDDHFGLPESID